MASNGTPQGWLYQQGAGNAPQVRDRSMEQYYSGSGNPNLPMWNSSGPSQTGAGGQGYGYNRYIPPMMDSWNGNWNTPHTGAGNPYSYNTPNSYGTNYWGGNTYQPQQTRPYGNQYGGQMPPQGFQRPQFSNAYGQGGGYGYGGPQDGGWGDPRMSQFGRQGPPREQLNPFGNQGGYRTNPQMPQGGGVTYDGQMYQNANNAMQTMSGQGYMPQWATKPYAENSFGRKPMMEGPPGGAVTQANAEPAYSPQFSRFLGMGY